MTRVDDILFSNVATAVQRTGNLTGGAVRGLPGGVVIGGLDGLQSLGAEMAEAKKEVRKERYASALQRVRQMEMQFNGAKGRWNGMVGSLITGARSGKQNLPMQKLNELKNAQAKMTQLTGPVTKTFRDLIYVLDHAVSMQGESETPSSESDVPLDNVGDIDEVPEDDLPTTTSSLIPDGYQLATQLRIVVGDDGKKRIEPRLQVGQYYLTGEDDARKVFRVEEMGNRSVWVSTLPSSQREEVSTKELKRWLELGFWLLSGENPADGEV